MIRQPSSSTRPDTLCPHSTLCRSRRLYGRLRRVSSKIELAQRQKFPDRIVRDENICCARYVTFYNRTDIERWIGSKANAHEDYRPLRNSLSDHPGGYALCRLRRTGRRRRQRRRPRRSEEHTSELQSLMRITY